MLPLVDIHCHLLAGLDDGPKTMEDALQMCRDAASEGVGMSAALAHQNEHYPDVTPDTIRESTRRLAQALVANGISTTVFPCAEVMARPDLEAARLRGELLTMADRGQYMLVEMPHGLFVDLRPTAHELVAAGIRPILAHPERQPEWLDEPGLIEELIEIGCLVQVSSGSVTKPSKGISGRQLRSWFRRGIVHLMGSDGHSPHRRPPRMAAAYHQIVSWAGSIVADRVFSTNGLAVLTGLPLHVPPPEPARRWFSLLW